MYKKRIKYTDYFGVEKERDFFFNLTESELMEMNWKQTGGLERLIEKITQTQDSRALVTYFKDLILKAYGEKSDDGDRFIKSEELSTAFSQTPAYNILFLELSSDANAAAEFINGIVPESVSKEMEENEAQGMNPALKAIQGKEIPLAIPKTTGESAQ